MNIENAFEVGADPDLVYAFLLDVNRVVGCVPGAELAALVDPSTFQGRVRIKVGPVTVAYNGTARISFRDEAARTATLEAEGRETTGPGSARATTTMAVTASGSGSTVTLATDYTVAGRVAQFGRGVMEDVSRRLVGQMAACIKERLESQEAVATDPRLDGPGPGGIADSPPGSASPPGPAAPEKVPATAAPVNALSLFWAVLWGRIRRLFKGSSQAPR
ncbi:MAG: SRPBCC family protein [Candidatus Dormibacteraceae bacterium]